MSNAVLLALEDVFGGYYPKVDVIQGVSLQIGKGEVMCMIGPNGAGKSTLLKMIYGVLPIRSGKLIFDGEDITSVGHLERLARGISYVPQGRCNFPLMTVQENLEMGAFSRDDNNISEDIDKIMDYLPLLKERRKQLAGNLSGGEQQMLEMAMALLLHPKLMLLDEPSLGLAPILAGMVFENIIQIRERGVTMIIVEQNAKRGLQIADHAVVLQLGTKVHEGTGEDILNNPEVRRLYLGG